ncbi:hypothetical protein GE21DRAFT_1289309 [Neurospora crassa]|nr:hypothetical protein GE21DRAFT_1289309 [Neurospora crassa]
MQQSGSSRPLPRWMTAFHFAIIPSRFRPSESHLDTCGRGCAAPCSTLPGDRQATSKPVNAPTDYHRNLRFHSDLVSLISSTPQDMTLGPSHHIDSSFRLSEFFPPLLLFFWTSLLKQGRAYTSPLGQWDGRWRLHVLTSNPWSSARPSMRCQSTCVINLSCRCSLPMGLAAEAAQYRCIQGIAIKGGTRMRFSFYTRWGHA